MLTRRAPQRNAQPLWTVTGGLSTITGITSRRKRRASGTGKPLPGGRLNGEPHITAAVTALVTLLVHLPRPAPKGSGGGGPPPAPAAPALTGRPEPPPGIYPSPKPAPRPCPKGRRHDPAAGRAG